VTRTYRPPPVGELSFKGRAGVVIEVAPNQFVEILMEIRFGDPADAADFSVEREVYPIYEDLLRVSYAPGITRGEVLLRGRVLSQEEAHERPRWANDAPEIEARREIES
jgi:hypothetical protein